MTLSPRTILALLALFATLTALHSGDDPVMKKEVEKAWAAGDFKQLEEIAEACRDDEMDILDPFPRLVYFYAAIRGPGIRSDQDARTREEKLRHWLITSPDSVTARVALADFHVTDAWRARGSQWAHLVKADQWPVFDERLRRARKVLFSEGMEIAADPSIAGLRVLVAMPHWTRGSPQSPYPAAAWLWPEAPPSPTQTHGGADWRGPAFPEQLEGARTSLYADGRVSKADPRLAGVRFLLGLSGENQPAQRLIAPYMEASRLWPEFFPVSDNVARALLPRWGGARGDAARFARDGASRFREPKASGFYALIAAMVLETEGMSGFQRSGFDIPRFLRGLDTLAREGEMSYRQFSAQRAAYVEALLGSPGKARQRIFAIGPDTIPIAYESYDNVRPAWKKCGAWDELEKGITLEREGKLPQAQEFYSSLTPAKDNPWLPSFVLRNGMESLWKPQYGTPSVSHPAEQANPNQLFELAFFHASAGNLDEARTYAEVFDRARPHNITGKYILAFAAATGGRREDFAKIQAAFLALPTDRTSYQLAQQYVAGKKSWSEVARTIPTDPYFVQACSMMAAIALGENRKAEAEEILTEVHRRLPFQTASSFAESALWGALSRKFSGQLFSKSRTAPDQTP